MLYIMPIPITVTFQILGEILELATTTIKKYQRKSCNYHPNEIMITFILNFRKKCFKFKIKFVLKIKSCLQKIY